jgi:hypothetical protein
VTVENQGATSETFNLTTYVNATIIEKKQITLLGGNSFIVSFVWNTTDFVKGSYIIKSIADAVLDETSIGDNIFIVPVLIHVVMPGDADADGDIDIYDVTMITSIYGLKRGDPYFNPNVDWLDDGVINIYDVVATTSVYGQKGS